MFGLQMTQKRNDAMINKLLFKNVVTQNTDVSIVPECSIFKVKLIFKDLKPSIFKYFSSLASPVNKTNTVLFTGLARLEKYLNTFLFTGLSRREKYLVMEDFKSLKINFTLKSAGETFETLKST